MHWPLAARAVVALGRLPHRDATTAEADTAAIDAALAAMDIADLAERPVVELSGGERARVLVARALAQQTPLLLADEPTAGLDPAHALALFELFTRLAAEGRTVVVALHDLTLAARFCPPRRAARRRRRRRRGTARRRSHAAPPRAGVRCDNAMHRHRRHGDCRARLQSAMMHCNNDPRRGGARLQRQAETHDQPGASGRRRAWRLHLGRARSPARGR